MSAERFSFDADILFYTIDAVARHGLSFWDAMLWSVVKEAGATVLLSEDLQDGRELGGVWFRDPFGDFDPFRAPVR